MSSRVRMRKPKGAAEGGVVLFPITLNRDCQWDFSYGPKGGGRLLSINSRNKCAWLWGELWRSFKAADEYEVAIRYALALHLIECHARNLDRWKGENEWPAILKGRRWSEGIVFPEEKRATREYFENILSAVKDDKAKEGATMPDDYDFVLMGHDMAQGLTWPEMPDWAVMSDCAAEIDRRNAEAFKIHAQTDGFEPREVK
jgi:hypothetical protein